MTKEKRQKKVSDATPESVAAENEQKSQLMDFSMAINGAKDGLFVRRAKWSEGTFVFLADLASIKKKGDRFAPFLAISSPDGYADPYTPSNKDIMANDWVLA